MPPVKRCTAYDDDKHQLCQNQGKTIAYEDLPGNHNSFGHSRKYHHKDYKCRDDHSIKNRTSCGSSDAPGETIDIFKVKQEEKRSKYLGQGTAYGIENSRSGVRFRYILVPRCLLGIFSGRQDTVQSVSA